MAPRSRLKFSAFEILYGTPFQASAQAGEAVNALKDLAVASDVKTWGSLLTSIRDFASNKSAYATEGDGDFVAAGEGSANLFPSKQHRN